MTFRVVEEALYGPIKSPLGTCATAIASLDIGCEAIQTGKEISQSLRGQMISRKRCRLSLKVTGSSDDQHPTTSSHSGFVEPAGCGVQNIMNA